MKYLQVVLTSSELDRIHSKINYRTDGCWEWIGAKIKNRGYGAFNFRGKTEMVHRLIYSHCFGKIPRNDMQNVVDHVCNNRACCNPKHLRITTQKHNSLRGNSPPAINKRKTHCKRGHKLPEKPNESWGKNRKSRRCVVCRRINAKKRYHKINN